MSDAFQGGHYSPVNNVRGDIYWGDIVHYDTGIVHEIDVIVTIRNSAQTQITHARETNLSVEMVCVD